MRSVHGDKHVTDSVERVGDVIDVTEITVEGERPAQVVERFGVRAGVMGNVAEGVERVRRAGRMIDGFSAARSPIPQQNHSSQCETEFSSGTRLWNPQPGRQVETAQPTIMRQRARSCDRPAHSALQPESQHSYLGR